MKNLGWMSYDVKLSGNRFAMPTDLRHAFSGQGKFVIYSDIKSNTLRICDKESFENICKKVKPQVRLSFNPREYDPKDDAQARGSFSATQMKLLGMPENVSFTAMDSYIAVINNDTVNYGVDNWDDVNVDELLEEL